MLHNACNRLIVNQQLLSHDEQICAILLIMSNVVKYDNQHWIIIAIMWHNAYNRLVNQQYLSHD